MKFWAFLSSLLYLIGSFLFLLGSIYYIDASWSMPCFQVGCDFEVAMYFLIGCFGFFLAAIIDFISSLYSYRHRIREHDDDEQLFFCRMETEKESLLATLVYFVASILFVIGSVYFLLLDYLAARYTYRAGSFMYIAGGLYGLFRLLTPHTIPKKDSKEQVVALQMTQLSNQVDPESGSQTDIPNEETKKIILKRIISQYCHPFCKRIRYNYVSILVRVFNMTGSTLFVTGGFCFDLREFVLGGHLWFVGSCFFTLASLVAMVEFITCPTCLHVTDIDSTQTVVTNSAEV